MSNSVWTIYSSDIRQGGGQISPDIQSRRKYLTRPQPEVDIFWRDWISGIFDHPRVGYMIYPTHREDIVRISYLSTFVHEIPWQFKGKPFSKLDVISKLSMIFMYSSVSFSTIFQNGGSEILSEKSCNGRKCILFIVLKR